MTSQCTFLTTILVMYHLKFKKNHDHVRLHTYLAQCLCGLIIRWEYSRWQVGYWSLLTSSWTKFGDYGWNHTFMDETLWLIMAILLLVDERLVVDLTTNKTKRMTSCRSNESSIPSRWLSIVKRSTSSRQYMRIMDDIASSHLQKYYGLR